MPNKSLFHSKTNTDLTADARNEAGGDAYRLPHQHALSQLAATGCFNGTFYGTDEAQLNAVLSLVGQIDDDTFLAKLAVYARQRGRMKDMPAALVVILASRDTELMHRAFDRVIDNGRMLRTLFQMIRSGRFGKKSLSYSLQRAFQRWLNKASVTQLLAASIGHDPSLRDVLRLARPTPINNERRALFGWLVGKDNWGSAGMNDLPEEVRLVTAYRHAGHEKEQVKILDRLRVRWDLLADSALGKETWKAIARQMGPQALRMNVGARFDGMAGIDENGKDTLKLGDLPENESRLALIRKRLPLFTHALEEDFKDLFLLLKDSARIGPDYLTLSVLSALIGTLGLLLDSAAVIIGAMVLAPLMAPIICLSMAALRRDFGLLRQSATAIGVGVGLSLAVSALVALLVPMRMLTPEIAARLAPSLIDLGVAVFSGVAGAYAYARESIMKSLPGVAIAVALVPPLAVAGIGVGWWDGGIVLGAGLLFLTNLVGIALAGAATFMVLGYGPVKRTTHGLLYPAAAAVLVAIPLALSYARMHFVWQAERQLAHSVYRIDGQTLELARPMVSVDGGLVRIRADVYVDGAATDADFAALRDRIARELDREVELDITVRARYR